MTPLKLRQASLDEAPLMTTLILTAFEDHRGKIDPPSGAHNETPEKIRAKLEQGGGIIASVDGADVGCVVYYPESADHMYLGRLAVLPAYRKHGIGQALVAAVEETARVLGFTQMTLAVRVALPLNRAFFEALGYAVTGFQSHAGYAEPTFMHLAKHLD